MKFQSPCYSLLLGSLLFFTANGCSPRPALPSLSSQEAADAEPILPSSDPETKSSDVDASDSSKDVKDIPEDKPDSTPPKTELPKDMTPNTEPKPMPTPEPEIPAVEQTIAVAKSAHFYFGKEDKRNLEFQAKLPEGINGYGRILLHIKLSCPDGRCDAWDRAGWFGVVSKLHKNEFLELVRFATPYGVGGEWTLDVTDFAPLLTGEQTFKGFIDTWVGPGHSAGNGWLLDVKLQFTPGSLAQKTVLIVPTNKAAYIAYGNPKQGTARDAELPAMISYKSAKLFALITGHGQGNSDNCAEFCPKSHSFEIGGKRVKREIWRNDCDKNPISNQAGTWKFPRAGWCPGDVIRPWVEDITSLVQTGKTKITYDVDPYENTCRPDAAQCKGCTLGNGCEYDGGAHTEPHFKVTSYVIYKN